LSGDLIADLRRAAGEAAVLAGPAARWTYGYDNSRRHAMPAAAVLAESAEQVAEVVRVCRAHRVPLVARGRGTGTTGAAVPAGGGVVLSLERMDALLEIAPEDRLAVVQPGVTNAALQRAAAAHGLFWPPDPTSAEACTIGGNLACNAAGPRAVKYGTPRDCTLGLEAVAGTGTRFRTGVRTTKGVVGYDLTRLLIGSEGTLAIITEATLRLTPLPEARRTLRAVYADVESAARAVARLMALPSVPCALEFMDRKALELVRGERRIDLPAGAGALLMIETDGPEGCIEALVAATRRAAAADGLLALDAARDETERAALWQVRKALSPALRNAAPGKINEDVVVPVSRLAELVRGLEALGETHRTLIVSFGHAGNGNLHVNLLYDPSEAEQRARAERCLDAVFGLVLELGGTLSGEHGVGLVKRHLAGRELDPAAVALMHALKAQFDPEGILNPGKTLPPPPGDQPSPASSASTSR